ncbi:TssQ family T6SS-associated lipoprotein [Massilia sp. CF038]|uniref:TssQ family T6SS-associated lipoprotein n=1 Tax=Massilia sp. CF038 TaxID=1881045 RepID=UPI001E330814|nr:TssQ family T6SS-associated lipoprotein [Massilia sp. CF038]
MKRLSLSLLTLTLLAGCDTLSQFNKPTPQPAAPKPAPARPAPPPVVTPPPPPAPTADEVALREGIAMYNKGQYNEAIKRLGSADIAGGAKANQVAAAKYTAFSYCVTARQILCRQQFDKAFKLDPAFDLLPGEHGHPLWGPAFTRAKKANKPK